MIGAAAQSASACSSQRASTRRTEFRALSLRSVVPGLESGLVTTAQVGPVGQVGRAVDGTDDDRDEQALKFVTGAQYWNSSLDRDLHGSGLIAAGSGNLGSLLMPQLGRPVQPVLTS